MVWGHKSTYIKVRPDLIPTPGRLGKLACPRVNDDQEIDVDDQKLNSGRPHDYWILGNLFYKMLFIIGPANGIHLRTTTNTCGRPVLVF